MQKVLKCHFDYCQSMDLRHLRNSLFFTQGQFCQNGHTGGIRVTFLDVVKCWKPVPMAILASPEGPRVVAQPPLPAPVPSEAA